MDLRRKVAFALAGVGLITTLVSSWTLNQAVQSHADVATYHDRQAVVAQAVSDLHADFFGYDGQMNMYVLVAATSADNSKLVGDTYAQAEKGKSGFEKDLATAAHLTEDSQLAESLRQIETSIRGYEGYAAQVRSAVQAGRFSEASHLQTVGNLEPSNTLMVALDAATTRSKQLAQSQLDLLDGRQTVVVASSIGLVVTILLLLAFLGTYISRSLRPLRQMEEGLDAMATGDLTAKLDHDADDEIGRMGAAMGRAVASLTGLVSEMNRVSADNGEAVVVIDVERFEGDYRTMA